MKIEEALYTYLKSHTGLSALVGSRIYPLKLPQNPTLPAVVYVKVSYAGERAMGTGNPRASRARFQFSCFAQSYASAKDVAEQVKLALQDYSGLMGGGVTVLDTNVVGEVDVFEPDTGLYHVPVDVLLIHR